MSTAKNKGGKRPSADWPARNPVLPTISATGTGPQSTVEHSASEQYLDSSQAGKIEANLGQDQSSGKLQTPKPHSEPLPPMVKRAAGLIQVTLPTHATASNQAESPKTATTIAVAGLAAHAWETDALLGVLCAYCPASWHHPRGIGKILRKLLPRLPDVSKALFLTLTYDRKLFAHPEAAFEMGRDRIRRILDRLRKGVAWEGRLHQFDAPYCVKLEFHADEEGWPHFHLVVLTQHYLPSDLVMKLWGLGFCKVRRINNHKFHYLLKYVTKGSGGYPSWALGRKRLRVFQPSHGFMRPAESQLEAKPEKPKTLSRPRKRASYTIGERQLRWARLGLFRQGKKYSTILLCRPFQAIFDELIESIAEAMNYLGNGFIKINSIVELIPWLLKPNPT